MIHAVVFDTDAPFRAGDAPASDVSAEDRLAGLTLLRRMILMAREAGAASATVVAHDPESARRWRSSEVALPIPVTVVGPNELLLLPDECDGVLVLSAQVLPQASLLDRLVDEFRAGRSVAAVASGAASGGPAVVHADDLRERSAAGESPTHAVEQLVRVAGPTVVDPRSYRHLIDQEAVAAADRDMYRGMTSASDGFVDRVFSRHVSRWFTRRIVNLPITPNQITWFHLALGLGAAGLFWRGGYVSGLFGAVLLQLSVSLDCSDGEVARLKFQTSRFGSQLDVAADNIINVAVFAAIAKAAAGRLGSRLALTLGALSVIGVAMCVLVVLLMVRVQGRLRPGEASSLAVTNRLSFNDPVAPATTATMVDTVINEVTSRDFTVLIVALAIINHLEWFAWLAGIGSHVFWVSFGAVQLSMLRSASAKLS